MPPSGCAFVDHAADVLMRLLVDEGREQLDQRAFRCGGAVEGDRVQQFTVGVGVLVGFEGALVVLQPFQPEHGLGQMPTEKLTVEQVGCGLQAFGLL